MQHTSHLLMIKPVHFSFNAETAVDNSFQTPSADSRVQEKALAEFNNFISILRAQGIDVTVIEDTPDPHTPDSVFPNNWISFHEEGTLLLYPMFAANRRKERKPHVLEAIRQKFVVSKTIDLSSYETSHLFLEGTGSMVLDRDQKIAYACLSQRTDIHLLNTFCDQMGYKPVSFIAADQSGDPVYHTNVMMCIADTYAVICLHCIPDDKEKTMLKRSIQESGKELIEISVDQMNHFAGNMLQVHNNKGEKFMVMSSQAFNSLTVAQKQRIQTYNAIIHADMSTIETNGGGSVRCMMAEVFLPLQQGSSHL